MKDLDVGFHPLLACMLTCTLTCMLMMLAGLLVRHKPKTQKLGVACQTDAEPQEERQPRLFYVTHAGECVHTDRDCVSIRTSRSVQARTLCKRCGDAA